MKRHKQPPFLSPAIMRRAFQARLLSVSPAARRIIGVEIQRIGGFEDRSYKLRYHLTLLMKSGRRKKIILRGSNEWADQTRRQAYVIMRYLWLHGFSSGPWRVARPVTFFNRWRLLVYEESRGVSLLTILRRPRPAAERYMKQVAAWLARLHSHSPRTLRLAYNQAGRKQYWLTALNVLSAAGQQESQILKKNIAAVMRFEDRLARQPNRVLVHHDFHLGNVLALPSGIRVVDFTESRLSSPLIDVATFLIQLELQLYQTVNANTIARWQKTFLQAYRRHAPGVNLHSPEARRIVRFIRFRIALQSFIALYLFGQPNSPLRKVILKSNWYYG